MSLTVAPNSDDIFGTHQHERKRAEYAKRVGILMRHLTDKLENIGAGNVFVGKYFPEEKMWEDLSSFQDSQVSEITKLGDTYFQVIFAKLTSK